MVRNRETEETATKQLSEETATTRRGGGGGSVERRDTAASAGGNGDGAVDGCPGRGSDRDPQPGEHPRGHRHAFLQRSEGDVLRNDFEPGRGD